MARAKHPDVPTEKVGLQELAFVSDFDAAICVDAMENVFPEDWPLVLANPRRYPALDQIPWPSGSHPCQMSARAVAS